MDFTDSNKISRLWPDLNNGQTKQKAEPAHWRFV